MSAARKNPKALRQDVQQASARILRNRIKRHSPTVSDSRQMLAARTAQEMSLDLIETSLRQIRRTLGLAPLRHAVRSVGPTASSR